jgi:hypothetical protein
MDGYVDLAYSPEELKARESDNSPLAEVPKYPYGLNISLDEKTLSKLKVDHGDWEVGDVFPVDILLKVTGKNINESSEGERCCINMQIIAMKGEEEPEELEETEAYKKSHDDGPDLKPHGYLKYAG